jgi:hypothetical protein
VRSLSPYSTPSYCCSPSRCGKFRLSAGHIVWDTCALHYGQVQRAAQNVLQNGAQGGASAAHNHGPGVYSAADIPGEWPPSSGRRCCAWCCACCRT